MVCATEVCSKEDQRNKRLFLDLISESENDSAFGFSQTSNLRSAFSKNKTRPNKSLFSTVFRKVKTRSPRPAEGSDRPDRIHRRISSAASTQRLLLTSRGRCGACVAWNVHVLLSISAFSISPIKAANLSVRIMSSWNAPVRMVEQRIEHEIAQWEREHLIAVSIGRRNGHRTEGSVAETLAIHD